MISGADYVVPPRSWGEIGDIADTLRENFGLSGNPYFPVVEFIEEILDYRLGFVRFEVGTKVEMEGAEGFTCPKGKFIMLREDVYENACTGEGRARFTAAHELGHLILHTSVPLARTSVMGEYPPFRLAEPQANRFAAELLMPRDFLRPDDDAISVSKRHGVSTKSAQYRINSFRRTTKKK